MDKRKVINRLIDILQSDDVKHELDKYITELWKDE